MTIKLLLISLLLAVSAERPAAAGHRYVNQTYGFAVTVPDDLSVATSPPPAPQHGIAATLDPSGRVWIDGAYDSRFLGSAVAALRDLASGESPPPAAPIRMTRLAGLEAAGLRFRHDDTVSALLVVYRPNARGVAIIYRFGLDTDRGHAARDERIFDRIVRSFAILPLPR